MKKTILATLICTSLFGVAGTALADGYQVRVHLKEKLSTWEGADAIYHPWVNMGDHYNCASWSPIPEAIDFGTSFTQSRDCSQNQQREVEIREMDTFSGVIKTVSRKQEDRTINETESQGAVGSYRNWVSFDSTYTEWSDFGTRYDYLVWAPSPSNQSADFTQNRGYKMNQERLEQKRELDTATGGVRNTGEPVRHEQADARTESRTVDVSFTAWTDTLRDGYTDWAPTSYNETGDFTQTREFGQHQIRDRVYAYSGEELGRFNETRVVSPVYENRAVAVTSTPWIDTNRSNYSVWSPAPTSETSSFTQSRTYTQNQERTWSYQADGTFLSSRVEPRGVDNQSESRTVTVSWTTWENSGVPTDCTAWSPDISTMNYGVIFTQTRSCSQAQTRTRNYVSGSNIGSHTENQSVSVDQSQSATGTKIVENWVTHTPEYGAWENTGVGYGYGTWSPAPASQTSSFSQTRSYSQDQTRTSQDREIDTISGQVRYVGSVVTQNQTQTLTDTRTITVSWTSWINSGSQTGCSTWSPSTSSVDYGVNFTQTRSCNQAQTRTRNYSTGESFGESRTINVDGSRSATGTYQNWATASSTCSAWTDNGSASYGSWSPAASTQTSSFTQTATYTVPQVRTCQAREYDSVTGTYRNVGSTYTETGSRSGTTTQTVTVSWTAWWDHQLTTDCTGWYPSTSTVTSGTLFTQTNVCKVITARYRNYSNGVQKAEYGERTHPEYRVATGTKAI